MKIDIDIDFGRIDKKCKAAVVAAQEWLDDEIVKDTNPYVPFLSGDLSKSPFKPGGITLGKIEYNEPYAARVYKGEDFTFTKNFHPLAGAYWFERSKAVNKAKWVNGVNKIAKENI